MTLFLLRGCQQAHKRLTQADNDATPIAAPTTSAAKTSLYLASDADASITATRANSPSRKSPPSAPAPSIDHLLAEYAQPNSAHRLQPGPAIDDVFLLYRRPDQPSTTPSHPPPN